jgi:hypothetical protein
VNWGTQSTTVTFWRGAPNIQICSFNGRSLDSFQTALSCCFVIRNCQKHVFYTVRFHKVVVVSNVIHVSYVYKMVLYKYGLYLPNDYCFNRFCFEMARQITLLIRHKIWFFFEPVQLFVGYFSYMYMYIRFWPRSLILQSIMKLFGCGIVEWCG